ncbi:hypothetical protein [Candidatus Spongiihabitans sp.]|uniref:hypothetical protein n=1 Tax=Candidatus Spongiihabitans sp. TaxID=3101308 RepID=UPI003C700506
MEIEVQTDETIEWLIDWKKDDILQVDYEYQRAPVWKPNQEQMFIDSVSEAILFPRFIFTRKKEVLENLFPTDCTLSMGNRESIISQS